MSPTPTPSVNPTCPTKKPSLIQKWVWGRCGPTVGKDLRTFSILFGIPALLIWLLNLDTPIARAVYHTDISHTGHVISTFLRRNGTLPGAILAILGLIALFWPKLYATRPLLYKTAMVVTLTAVLGVGVANQLVVKNLADRTRPHESVLTTTPQEDDGFRGNSMPSGHAAMGFLLAAPFFPLRRSRPKLAATFLTAGIVSGTIVGLSRMMLGAHFATDVLIAGLITFSAATIFNHVTERITRIPTILIGLAILIGAIGVVLGNRFVHFTLTYPVTRPFLSLDLPCQPTAIPVPTGSPMLLTVYVTGYGAPLSTLKIVEKEGIISIYKNQGLYHHLSCTATLTIPGDL